MKDKKDFIVVAKAPFGGQERLFCPYCRRGLFFYGQKKKRENYKD